MPDPGRIPGPIVIPSCVEVMLRWSLPNSKTIAQHFHGSVAGGFSATSVIAEALFAGLKASAAWTAFKPFINSGVNFEGVDLRDLRTAELPLVSSTGGAAAGTGAGTALPPGDALVVTLRTALAGRANRGRVYLAGFDSTALAAGGVAAALCVSTAHDFVEEVKVQMTAQSLTMAIGQPARQAYTGTTGTAHAPRAATTQTVTDAVVRNNIFDHQRRRAGKS